MTEAVKINVRSRAKNRCEYCLLHQDDSPLALLHIEHIRPKKHGGSDSLDNLCLACIDCNLRKGSNLTGIDPESEKITELFNPRQDTWKDHFEWDGIHLKGKSAIARTTIRVLDMNSDDRLDLRLSGEEFPSETD